MQSKVMDNTLQRQKPMKLMKKYSRNKIYKLNLFSAFLHFIWYSPLPCWWRRCRLSVLIIPQNRGEYKRKWMKSLRDVICHRQMKSKLGLDEIKSTRPPSRRISSHVRGISSWIRFIPPERVDLVEKDSELYPILSLFLVHQQERKLNRKVLTCAFIFCITKASF